MPTVSCDDCSNNTVVCSSGRTAKRVSFCWLWRLFRVRDRESLFLHHPNEPVFLFFHLTSLKIPFHLPLLGSFSHTFFSSIIYCSYDNIEASSSSASHSLNFQLKERGSRLSKLVPPLLSCVGFQMKRDTNSLRDKNIILVSILN